MIVYNGQRANYYRNTNKGVHLTGSGIKSNTLQHGTKEVHILYQTVSAAIY